MPIMDFDFRVTTTALQALRGHILQLNSWPEELSAEHRIMANFLDLPITPTFLTPGSDFQPFEHRYTSKITELTGHNSYTKNFVPDGKTFRDFAEHRLGVSLETALFVSLMNYNKDGRAVIPSLGNEEDFSKLINAPVTHSDFEGLSKAIDIILNPMLETGSFVIKMNPLIEQEFPNMSSLRDESIQSKTFGEVIGAAVSPTTVPLQVVTA